MKRAGKMGVGAMVLILALLLAYAPAAAQGGRWAEIIIDASGSMKNRLPGGETRLEAAKAAVAELAPKLPADTHLALRAYGHQSPTSAHDCQDTQLLVGFAPAAQAAAEVAAKAKALPARGYTPITYVLTLAAGDFPAQATGERVIVLVSDGRETCPGDPCAAAKALADKYKVVIHTVGLGVDQATMAQLTCLAQQTGGRYFPAESAKELATVMGQAVTTKVERRVVPKPGPGKLTVKGADLRGHVVTRAEDGQKVTELGHTKDTAEMPSGIYNVTVGKAVWRSVEVKPGQTTVLQPARLELKGASYRGHKVLEMETGEEHGELSNLSSSMALMPGEYLVSFGTALWPVRLEPGQKLVLQPAILEVKGATLQGQRVLDSQGGEVGVVSSTGSSIPLPPGEYAVTFGPLSWPVRLELGQRLVLQPGVLSVKGASIQGHRVYSAQGVEVGMVSATGSSLPLPPGDYEVDLGGAREKFSLQGGLRVELVWK